MKIEKSNEKNKRREREAADRGFAGQEGISLFQAVGCITGEMKEYRSWLKGRQMPGEEEAGQPRRRPSLWLGLRKLLPHSPMMRAFPVGVFQLCVDSSGHNVIC